MRYSLMPYIVTLLFFIHHQFYYIMSSSQEWTHNDERTKGIHQFYKLILNYKISAKTQDWNEITATRRGKKKSFVFCTSSFQHIIDFIFLLLLFTVFQVLTYTHRSLMCSFPSFVSIFLFGCLKLFGFSTKHHLVLFFGICCLIPDDEEVAIGFMRWKKSHNLFGFRFICFWPTINFSEVIDIILNIEKDFFSVFFSLFSKNRTVSLWFCCREIFLFFSASVQTENSCVL